MTRALVQRFVELEPQWQITKRKLSQARLVFIEKCIPAPVLALQKYPPLILLVLWILFSFGVASLCTRLIWRLHNSRDGNHDGKRSTEKGYGGGFVIELMRISRTFFLVSPVLLSCHCVVNLIIGCSRRFIFLSSIYVLYVPALLILVPFILRKMRNTGVVSPIRQPICMISLVYSNIEGLLEKYSRVRFHMPCLLVQAVMSLVLYKCLLMRFQGMDDIQRKKNLMSQLLYCLALFFFASAFSSAFSLILWGIFRPNRSIVVASYMGSQMFELIINFIIFLSIHFTS